MTSPFSDDELEQLRAKAEKATPGPWEAYGHQVIARDAETRAFSISQASERNAPFIAAADPSTILRLLASVEKANAERDDERELSARLVDERIEVDTRVTRLREALLEYGRHKHDCEDRLWLVGPRAAQNVPRPPCSCGYIDALASHGESEGEGA